MQYEPQIEENVPIPLADSTYLTQRKRLAAAEKTLDVLPEYGLRNNMKVQYPERATDVPVHELVMSEALGRELPPETVRGILRTPEKVREARRLIADFDDKVVTSAASIRNYVTTRLVLESDHKDPKIRMQALTLLGKITDVGLFTEKTEISVTNKTSEELEARLREKLQKFLTPGGADNIVEDATIRPLSLYEEYAAAKAAKAAKENNTPPQFSDD